jgi:hypothetical protein
VFTDFEEPFFNVDGSYAPQSKRVAYMRAVLKPLGGEKINFNFVRFPASKPVCDVFGNPMGSGTIGRTSNPCSYSRNIAEWKQHRKDVETCYAPVIPHLPPIPDQGQGPDDALQQIRDAIVWDAARGVTTWTLATYMMPPEHWDEMVNTVADALEAADMSSAGVNA